MSGPIPWISFLMVQVLVSTTITVAGTAAVGEAAALAYTIKSQGLQAQGLKRRSGNFVG
jgi:hypothetical protein